MNIHNAATAAKALIRAAKVNSPDAELAQNGRAHYAWLHRHVEVGLRKDAGGVAGEDLGERDEFGVPRALP